MPRLSANLLPTSTAAAVITAGAFIVGSKYRIVTAGTTDFTLIGAADSNVGTVFTASGAGTGTGTASLEIDGTKVKGDGFYNYSDGLHTSVHYVAGFTGTIEIQGALTADPVEADWVTVAGGTTVGVALTENVSFNFTGNFVWIRARVTNFTAGTITKIQLNH